MKRFFLAMAILVLAVLPGSAEKIYRLESGIKLVAKELSAKLPEGTKVVVLGVRAKKPEASDYIEEELTYELLQLDNLVVVDRQNLDAIRQELSLQVSGDVSDESAQRLGAMLGAEVLVSGSFDLLAGQYRLSMKAVQVETSQIKYLSSLSVASDAETEAILGRKAESGKTESAAGTAVKKVAGFTGRLICSSVNPFFGIGSYMQGDMEGGGKVSFWEVAGGITFGIGAYRDANGFSNGPLLMGVGGGVFGVTVVYSIIRPWIYNRNPAAAEVVDNLSLSIPDKDSLSIGYTIRY